MSSGDSKIKSGSVHHSKTELFVEYSRWIILCDINNTFRDCSGLETIIGGDKLIWEW